MSLGFAFCFLFLKYSLLLYYFFITMTFNIFIPISYYMALTIIYVSTKGEFSVGRLDIKVT